MLGWYMNTGNGLKDKIIIVAHQDEASSRLLTETLKANGFFNVFTANDGEAIYRLLKPFQEQPEQLGLIVMNESLPNCQLFSMCESFACSSNGSVIPFIIMRHQADEQSMFAAENKLNFSENCLIHNVDQPVNIAEFLLVVVFLLQLKQERWLRQQQQEQLLHELATKNVIDAKLKFLVAHDELTGLFNRSGFEQQLRLALKLSYNRHKQGALLFIDVDRFSMINELEGFEVGDRLLVELTILVRKLVPAGSLFARIGADEFCLFLDNKSKSQALVFAETIKSTVDNFRFFSGEVCYSATISIGIACLDNTPHPETHHPGELILHARQACHYAKLAGRDKVRAYNSDDIPIKERRLDIYWVPIIRKALRENLLFLVFQPVVYLSNGAISHYEVLLRMRGDHNQVIGPDKFIPTAERIGLIHALDLWVVEHAIDFLAALPTYLSSVALSVNLSSTAFQYPDLLEVIRDKLELTWVDASRITFEITETAAVDNFEKTREMINKIRILGCKFALDDFGAGFCSFNYLKTFPVDYVKIDGQFIKNLLTDETDQILVKSMVDIAGKLGKKTIAEFVESPGTALKLKELGINMGQGYAFGRPETQLIEGPKVSLAMLLAAHPAPVLTMSADMIISEKD